MTTTFWKYEGLGNDFLVVDAARAPTITPALAARLCDRHFGVGGDGVLVTGLMQGRPFMKVVNADGSVPEMCGNGLRCVALFLVQHGHVSTSSFAVDTDAGPHAVEVDTHGSRGDVTVHMRRASLSAADVLSAPASGTGAGAVSEHIERAFAVDGRILHLTCVSMGNPHAVLFDTVEDLASLGPRIEKDPRFKAGVNVGFARLRDARTLDLTVWERGVGFTLACGTGACAAAVAAVETGRCPRGESITVHLPGGPLTIRVGERGDPIEMRGPARSVFVGQVDMTGDVAAASSRLLSRAEPHAATEESTH